MLTIYSGEKQYVNGGIFLSLGETVKIELVSSDIQFSSKSEGKIELKKANAHINLEFFPLLYGAVSFKKIEVFDTSLSVHSNRSPSAADSSDYNEIIKEIVDKNFKINKLKLSRIDVSIITQPGVTQNLNINSIIGVWDPQGNSKIDAGILLDDKRITTEISLEAQHHQKGDFSHKFNVNLQYGTTYLNFDGRLVDTKEQLPISGDFSFGGENFNEISQIVDHSGSHDVKYSVTGNFRLNSTGINVQVKSFVPVAELIDINIKTASFPDLTNQLKVSLNSPKVDINELTRLIFSGDQPRKKSEKLNFKEFIKGKKIFPDSLPIDFATISVNTSELLMGNSTYRDVSFETNLIDGEIHNSPFMVTLNGNQIQGEFSFLYEHKKPTLLADLKFPSLDLGSVFKELEIGEKPADFNVHNVSFKLATQGTYLGELLNNLKFDITSGQGELTYIDKNTETPLQIVVNKMQMSAIPSKKIHLSFDGHIKNIPLEFSFSIDDKRGHIKSTNALATFEALAKSSGAQLILSGHASFPLTIDGLKINSILKGTNLKELSNLVGVQLPEIGPYKLSSIFSVVGEGYKAESIELSIGQTKIAGDIFVNTKTTPVIFRAKLLSPMIQVDDFRNAWLENQSNKVVTRKRTKRENQNSDNAPPFITDQELLDSYDASIQMQVDKVMSGEDYLGNGLLVVNQTDGKFKIDPLKVWLPHGFINFNYLVEPSGVNRHYKLNLDIEDFNYGILGRYLKPDTDIDGTIDIRMHIDSNSPNNKEIMQNGTGYFDVMVKPERIRSGVIDLWAVNLFNYLLPYIRPNRESKINCVSGVFDLKNGILTEKGLLIDTSRIQVKGKFKKDFNKKWIEAYLRPIPKRSQFFSLSTPIEIKGSLKKTKIGAAKGGIFSTIVRLVTSPIVIPLQWIILNPISTDGSEYCKDLFNLREVK